MTKVGLIGTGMLGEAVGLHLLESGYDLNVYNRTKSKTKNETSLFPIIIIHFDVWNIFSYYN